MPKHGNTQIKSWAYSAAPLVKKNGKKIKKIPLQCLLVRCFIDALLTFYVAAGW